VAAAAAVAPVESAIAGKRLTLIEQAKGCHGSMALFFVSVFRRYSRPSSRARQRLQPVHALGRPDIDRFFDDLMVQAAFGILAR
jgi:hypothetical protein